MTIIWLLLLGWCLFVLLALSVGSLLVQRSKLRSRIRELESNAAQANKSAPVKTLEPTVLIGSEDFLEQLRRGV